MNKSALHSTARRRLIASVAAFVIAGVPLLSAQVAHAQTSDPKPVVTLKIAKTSLGDIVVDGKGLSVYMFKPDRYNVSVCEGQCLVAWPPIMLPKGSTLTDVSISDGMRRSKLGVAMREDGSRQVTYNGLALYYWFRDSKPGDVFGQWVNELWFVMSEDGTPNTNRVPKP